MTQKMRDSVVLVVVGAVAISISSVALAGPRSYAVAVPATDRMPDLPGREVFVAPDGKADAAGTKEAPINLAAAFGGAGAVKPGDVVWIRGGTYKIGDLELTASGEKDKPIVFRAVPGERATFEGQILWKASHAWLWGVEVTGPPHDGITLRAGDDIKLINLVLHDNGAETPPEPKKPTGMGLGGWDVGNDHEYYGNIIYSNGINSLDHGIYSQNTAEHTTKKYLDNIIFENAGCGIHVYGQSPKLANLHLEGNISFATSQHPKHPAAGQMNILVGGYNPLTDVTLLNNCTWHPQADSKRGVDVGYTGKGNSKVRVEGNYFMCGANAMEIKSIAQDVTVKGNTFWAPAGMVDATLAPEADKATIAWDRNTFIDNGKFDLKAWQERTGFDKNSKLLPGKDGKPTGLHVFRRVNQYEPSRVHLAVYNWDHKPAVDIDVADIAQPGSEYRVVSVLDYFGEPVAKGKITGKTISLPMAGHRYEPEFGAYVLIVDKPIVATTQKGR